jgi:hypothetical protein
MDTSHLALRTSDSLHCNQPRDTGQKNAEAPAFGMKTGAEHKDRTVQETKPRFPSETGPIQEDTCAQ